MTSTSRSQPCQARTCSRVTGVGVQLHGCDRMFCERGSLNATVVGSVKEVGMGGEVLVENEAVRKPGAGHRCTNR